MKMKAVEFLIADIKYKKEWNKITGRMLKILKERDGLFERIANCDTQEKVKKADNLFKKLGKEFEILLEKRIKMDREYRKQRKEKE